MGNIIYTLLYYHDESYIHNCNKNNLKQNNSNNISSQKNNTLQNNNLSQSNDTKFVI